MQSLNEETSIHLHVTIVLQGVLHMSITHSPFVPQRILDDGFQILYEGTKGWDATPLYTQGSEHERPQGTGVFAPWVLLGKTLAPIDEVHTHLV